ncbi:MAG: SDR family NAD(P)-dependent oxidoreductase [Hyphomicrobiaceae bacterium]
MLISTQEELAFAPEYPELAGKRVLITGVCGPLGVEIVRAFAEAQVRVVVQTNEDSRDMQTLAEIIAPEAMDVHFFPGPLEGADAMLKFAREAVQKFGGLDCVINIATVPEPSGNATEADIEAMVTDILSMSVLATQVVANRMRTMLSGGSILNVLTVPAKASGSRKLIGRIARNALAHFTRNEAEKAEHDGIHVNAVVPAALPDKSGQVLMGTVDVATLALHLSSGREDALSGLVFEAWCG